MRPAHSTSGRSLRHRVFDGLPGAGCPSPWIDARGPGLTLADRVPPPPSSPGERWSMDFMADTLADGRAFRTLNIVDLYACCPRLAGVRQLGHRRASADRIRGRRPGLQIADPTAWTGLEKER